jgi:uncharacterized protein (TIGR03545 family)
MRERSGWFSWRIVLPWSCGILGLFAAAHLLLAWAIEHEIVDSGEHRVGARVEVGDTRVNLLKSRVTLFDLHVANPLAPLRNLIEAEHCVVQLDPESLLHKRAIVRYGVVSGITLGTDRATSGALTDDDAQENPAIDGWLDETATKQAQDWLDGLHKRFDRNLVQQLESIRLADELFARWPEQSDALGKRVAALRGRTLEFHTKIRDAQENPLRHVEFLKLLPRDIRTIRDELASLGKDIANLPSIAEEDRVAIVAAREHDEQLLRDELQFEPIDANVLSAYLLQKQLNGPLADLVGWLRLARRLVPVESKPHEHKRRGHDVLFTGCHRTPDLLVRKLLLQGTANFADQPVEFSGTITDIADKPARHDQPIRLKLITRGGMPLDVQATIDRTGAVPRDQLLVECGNITLPKLRLGRSNKLRLSLAPTTATINISITLEGDKLSGDVQLVQRQVQITPTVGDELVRRKFDAELHQALGEIETLETRISLTGSLDHPQCQVWSNLGPAVAEGMNKALVRTTAGYTRELLAESHSRVDERLADLDRQIADAQSLLEPQLEEANGSLDQLTKKTATQRLSLDHLGRRPPEDSLFR